MTEELEVGLKVLSALRFRYDVINRQIAKLEMDTAQVAVPLLIAIQDGFIFASYNLRAAAGGHNLIRGLYTIVPNP